ncbi:HYR domain-containing protein [Rathayibacter sp. AY1A7]|uniref:HYR domain-containing protein n=1 Tax=Rathayibacter sp. AY1A7 TaxID=2080524 RepID=UPI0011B07778|nr:HYR domain-containing protein [Rathayibacter sp. AY1A7]
MRQSFLRSLVAAAVLVAGAGLSVVAAPTASAAPVFSTACFTSPKVSTVSQYTVPATGVSTVRAVLSGQNGGKGASGLGTGNAGGRGSSLVVEVPVTPGQVLEIGRLTGAPAGAAGATRYVNGGVYAGDSGGAGGDAQYLSTAGSDGCQHALAVAAGGGGGGGRSSVGGDADAGSGARGGGNGGRNNAADGGGGGAAGQSSGGSPGARGYSTFGECADGNNGQWGVFLNDGKGADAGASRGGGGNCSFPGHSGGGGGAGWWYGGGGGSPYVFGSMNDTLGVMNDPGAGGGGSSYVHPSATRISQTAGPTAADPVVAPVYDTAVTVTRTPDFSMLGQEVTVTARVTIPSLGRPVAAGGTVEILTGAGTSRVTLDADGVGVLTTRDIPQGWNEIRAHYPDTITPAEAGRGSWSALPALRHEVRACAATPVITRQPSDIAGVTNQIYTLTMGVSVSAVYGGIPAVSWERSTDGGATWKPALGRAGAREDGTAFLEAGPDPTGSYRYRATLTTCGGSVRSEPATVAVGGVRFDLSTLPQKAYGDSFDASPYAQAVDVPGRSIVLSSRTAETCSVSGMRVTVLHAGVCTLAARLDALAPLGWAGEPLQSFTAKPKALTVTAPTVDYPRGAPSPDLRCTAAFVGTDTFGAPLTAGVYRPIVTADDVIYRLIPNWPTSTFTTFTTRCSGAKVSSDYTIAGYKDGALRIVAAVPMVTASSPSSTYGSTPPAITASVTGSPSGTVSCGAFAASDTGFTTPLALSATTPVGRYPTRCSGLTNPSGQLITIDGALTISPAPLSVTASSPGTQAHGTATAPTVTCTADGFAGTDRFVTEPTGAYYTADGTGKVTIGARTPVGDYVTRCDGGDAGPNYTLRSIPGTFALADRSAPVVTVPAAVTAEPADVSGAVVTFASSAQDAVDGAVGSTCTPASGSVFPIGDTTVDCTADDEAGNTGTSSFRITVRKFSQTVAFTSSRPTAPTALGTFTPTATGGGSGSPVSIGATGSCAIADGIVTFTRGGTCTVTADQAGDDHYTAGRASFDLEVAKASQTLTVAVPKTGVLESTGVATATSSSGLPVLVRTFFGCTVAPDATGAQILTYTEPSTCGVQFDQPGDDVYAAADGLVRFVPISRIPQTVVVTSTPPDRVFTDDRYTVEATGGGSGNPLVIAVIENGNCTIADDVVTFFGDGTCTVTIDQAADDRHDAAPQVRQVITVGTPEGNLSFGSTAPPHAMSLETYRPTIVPGPSKGVPVLSASRDCSILPDGVTVRNDGAGLCVLSLDQPGDGYWPARHAEQEYSIYFLPQTVRITSAPPVGAVLGDTYRPVIEGGASGIAPFLLTTASCSAKDGVVTFTTKGVCGVFAYQNGNRQYDSARPAVQEVEVGYAPGSVTFTTAVPTDAEVGGSFTPAFTRGPSSGPSVLSVSGACSDGENGAVRFDSAGTCTLTAIHYRDATYGTARAVQTFEITAIAQTVAFTSTAPSTATSGDTLTPTATGGASGLPVTIGATGACTLADGVVTFAGSGTCTVTADQAGDGRYAAAAQASQTVAVTQLAGTVAFGGDAPAEARVGGSSTAAVVAGPSSAPSVLTASGACSVGPFRLVSYDSAGTCTLTLDQAGDIRHSAAPTAVRSFEITRVAQTVAFTSQAPDSALSGGTYRPTATGGASGRPVVLGASGSCTLTNGVVAFTGSGTCTVTADQTGDARYDAAERASQVIAVGLLAGTVSFGGTAPTGATVGGTTTPRIIAGPSTARPVLTASGACSAAAGVVSYDSVGTCTLTLDQAGDSRYGAAPQSVRTFAIGALGQTLAFASPVPDAAVAGGSYTPVVTAGASSAPVVLGAAGSCTVADGVVTFTRSGTCTVTADQAGDERHSAAPRITQSVEVGTAAGAVSFRDAAPTDARIGGSWTPSIVRGPSSADPVLDASDSCSLGEDGTVSYDSVGTCTLTLDQAGDDAHAPAEQVVRTFPIGKARQTVAFTSAAPSTAIAGGRYTPTATGGSSDLPVTIGATGACSLASGVVTFSGSGTCTVTADQAGDASHDAAPRATQSIAVAAVVPQKKKAQKVAFSTAMPSSPEKGIAYPVAATASSGLPVKLYASGTCTLTATGAGTATVRLTGAASCTVRATQAGDSAWLAATSVTQSLQVKSSTRADLTLALAPAPGLAATAPLSGTITVRNTGTRDAATTTTRVVVSGTVASAPGAVQTKGSAAGTTVLTWTAPSVSAGRSTTYSVTLVDRPAATTIDARVSTAAADPTPANNAVRRTFR